MITVIQEPAKYSLSDNVTIFQFQSNNPAIMHFKIELLDAVNSAIIGVLTAWPKLNNLSRGYLRIERIISNTVKWEVSNTQNNLYIPITRTLLKYKVRVTEYGMVNGEIVALQAPTTLPDTYTIWNGEIGGLEFHSFNPSEYVIGNTGLPVKFLTYKPNNALVNQYSTEQLYFLQDYVSSLKIVINVYNKAGGSQTFNEFISGLNLYNQFMIQVSPKMLADYFIIDLSDLDYYTVHLEDVDGNKKTETRKYIYEELGCQVIPMNLIWVNSLGGVDSYTFQNPIETNNVTRSSYKKNPYQLVNGFIVDKIKDVFNTQEEILNIKQQGNYTLHTRFLSDAEVRWFNELVISKQVFVELSDFSLLPVILETTTYKVDRQQYDHTKPIQKTFDIHYDSQLIPSELLAYGGGFNGSISLDFIRDQFDTN